MAYNKLPNGLESYQYVLSFKPAETWSGGSWQEQWNELRKLIENKNYYPDDPDGL